MNFSVPLKKENDSGKKITYKLKFLIATESCQLHYQILLITYWGVMIKNVKNAWKEKN